MAVWDDLNLEHPITIYDSSIGLEQSYYSDSFSSHRLSYPRGSVVLPSIATNEPLLEEMNHFVEVIRNKTTNRCSGKYAAEVVKTLVQADQSIQVAVLLKSKIVSRSTTLGAKVISSFTCIGSCFRLSGSNAEK